MTSSTQRTGALLYQQRQRELLTRKGQVRALRRWLLALCALNAVLIFCYLEHRALSLSLARQAIAWLSL